MTQATAPARPLAELTIRGVLLGGLITLLFTAANVYLGLKVGLTFATSIPAAVISMAILRYFKDSTILENNIVQTVASAAGTLAAIIFVLPGLVMIGWWTGFPYLLTAAICATGGILGVMFSVPLRRALVVDGNLPYPEGRAAAEVLKVGAESRAGAAESGKGLAIIVINAVVSAGFAAFAKTKLVVEEAAIFFRAGAGATGISGGLSFALFGAGHLVGISVGMAMFTGLVIGWWILLPILTAQTPMPGEVEAWAGTIFRNDVRFFGAGVIGVAAIWSLIRIAAPVTRGIRAAMAASGVSRGGDALPIEERDIPFGIVVSCALATMIPIAILLWSTLTGGPLEGSAWLLVGGALLFVAVIGLVIAAVCGYMAGLIGASNSPVSGIGILSVLAASLLLVGLFGRGIDPASTDALIAYALIVTGVVFGVATISNDNLQDLKTGQLVGATPWKQQLALVFGVIFGSMIIPPVLNLLNETLGFAGAPNAGPNALAAPQAALISALAKGVLGGGVNWPMIQLGALVGVGVIIVDELLGKAGKLRLPPLAIGIGVYLPMAVTLPVVLGSVIGMVYDRWADRTADPEFARRMGVLTATGLIVGESLWGVSFALIVYATNSDAPMAIAPEGFGPVALIAGPVIVIALLAALYRYTRRQVMSRGT
ncbi:MAG: OPT family oligopeptide transporter [Sphingobium sp.]